MGGSGVFGSGMARESLNGMKSNSLREQESVLHSDNSDPSSVGARKVRRDG